MGNGPLKTPENSSPLDGRIATALAVMHRIDAARNGRELGERLIELTKPFGVEAILAGVLPSNLDLHPLNSALTPEEWALLASHASSFDERATILLIDLNSRTTHFFFLDPASRQIKHKTYTSLESAAAKSLWTNFDGALFPIVTIGPMQCGFAFLGRSVSQADAAADMMSFIANYAFARALRLDNALEHLPKMSERQLEALKWAAKGKTDHEIAEIMNLSVYTVDKYMRQCKEALGAGNRTKLIVRAMRYGLIS